MVHALDASLDSLNDTALLHEFGDLVRQAKEGSAQLLRGGDCWDNAVAESFFSSFGFELEFEANWQDEHDVERDAAEYIDGFYNPRRRHSAIGYLSPIEFELKFMNEATTTQAA